MNNDIRTFPDDDHPRISSRALAEMLGMSHEDMLALIEQHKAELERHGPLIKTKIPDKADE
jgi:phage regulator Rha-like protein